MPGRTGQAPTSDGVDAERGDDEADAAVEPSRTPLESSQVVEVQAKSSSLVRDAVHGASLVAAAAGQAGDRDVVSKMLRHKQEQGASDLGVRCLTARQVDTFREESHELDRAARKNSNLRRPSPVKSSCPRALRVMSYGKGGRVEGHQSWNLEGQIDDGPMQCCYTATRYTKRRRKPLGRRFYVENRATRATTRGSQGWMGVGVDTPRGCSDEALASAAHAWLEDALEEHASIAAFSRATLELMALGAPAELLAEYQRASLDEIEHARACFALVGALTGEDVSADRIEVEGPRDDLDEIVADVFWGGCVGESVAALCAQRALCGCEWEAARAALEEISEDEARHAALAWSTLSFLGEVEPERVRRVLSEVEVPRHEVAADDEVDEAWAALGRLTSEQEAQAEADAWEHLILPMLDALLQVA